MTIEQRIQKELDRLSRENAEIHSVASKLNEKFNELIENVKDHLSEISNEMREYDKHDATHSEAVLWIIEELLQEQHIEELTLLEAMVLRFCCYFHDAGMILPAFCKPLLEQVEGDPKADPQYGLKDWLAGPGKDFESVKELFLLPETRDKYLDFLIRELMAYRDVWLGLEPKPEDMDREVYVKTVRHNYLRSKHGERVKVYAQNLSRAFAKIIHGSEAELAKTIGEICAAHSWEIKDVHRISVKKELFANCPELSCNVRYLAMLLRLGDLLHFGPERASETLYLERAQMNRESDLHWRAKQGTRGYRISPKPAGGVDISYHGSFDEPQEYYFVQGHMNWVDEELGCYENFRRQMEVRRDERKYDLGLPETVDRTHLDAQGFTPDRDFKFKLEHRNIIELLMGARLYRDEFMCLRELYQNALDACRCMRAERPGQETEIEFGLGEDDDGKYLYCKDQGIGMTMDIIKNYLLRIGNSYYKSDEFRRKNAHWGNVVAPVSEFGIGLLSCYMIADRIDVITRHYTAVDGEKPIWISMSDSDDFGYQRETNWFLEDELGEHGTIVKLYLKEKFIPMATGYIPEEPRDAVFLLDRCDPDKNNDLSREATGFLAAFKNSLYHRVQQFVHIPEPGIPVWIAGNTGRENLFCAAERYDLIGRIPHLMRHGFTIDWLMEKMLRPPQRRAQHVLNVKGAAEAFSVLESGEASIVSYRCCVENELSDASAFTILRLPAVVQEELLMRYLGAQRGSVGKNIGAVYIDGIPIRDGAMQGEIWYSFRGAIRPRLTVDRGELREIPETVWELRHILEEKLIREIARTIRQHVARYPNVRTQEFWEYVVYDLGEGLPSDFVMEILRDLSGDVMRDYVVLGAPLYDWFHREELSLEGDALRESNGHLRYVLAKLLFFAASVRIEGGRIVIRKGPDRELEGMEKSLLDWIRGGVLWSYLVQTDSWPVEFSDYDAVDVFPGLIPKHTWLQLERMLRGESKFGWNEDLIFRKVRDHYSEREQWLDELRFLQEKGIQKKVEAVHFKKDGNRRYVAYVFFSPRKLTAKEETDLKYYNHVPDYIRGVREGWSILFYNYKDGYVIAPGIQKREDMLKLLPKEALEHDDGLEYYFTDDTFAF